MCGGVKIKNRHIITMVYKTRKINKRRNFKNLQKNRYSAKYYKPLYGGTKQEPNIQTISSLNNNDNAGSEIMDKIEAQNKISIPDINEIPVVGPVIEKTGNLIEGSSIKAIDSLGNLIGVNIDNPGSISKKLSDIKSSLSNPKNVEQLKEIAREVGKYGEVAAVAIAPAAQRFVDTTLPIVADGFDKAVKSGVATGVNLLEDVAGPFIGIPRTILSAAEAFNASVNAGSELIKGASESVQGTYENYERLMNKMNNVSIPNVEMPNVKIPNVEMPNVKIPNVEMPNVKIPNVEMPNVKIPDYNPSIETLKNTQKEAKMIGGRVHKSHLYFLTPQVYRSQILKQHGGKVYTKKRNQIKRKLSSRSYKY